jgi:hypothetical protein
MQGRLPWDTGKDVLLRIDEACVVAPIASAFPLGSGVEAVALGDFLVRAPRR